MKRRGDSDFGCILLLVLLLAMGGCVSCGFSGCGVKVQIGDKVDVPGNR